MEATPSSTTIPEETTPQVRLSSKTKRNYRTKKHAESDNEGAETEDHVANVNEQEQGSNNEPTNTSTSTIPSEHPYVQSQNAQSLGEVYPGLARLSFLDQESRGIDEGDQNDISTLGAKKPRRPLQQKQLQPQTNATDEALVTEGGTQEVKGASIKSAAAVPPTISPSILSSGSGLGLIEIRDTGSSVKGRGLFSTHKEILKPGTLVFKELGYCQVVDDASLSKVCSACFKDVREEVGEEETISSGGTLPSGGQRQLVRCSACHIVWYCNKTCQGKDWKLHHQLECEGIRKSKSTPATSEVWTKRTVDTTAARALCRMIRRRERAKASAAYKAEHGKMDQAQRQVNDVYVSGLDEKEESWLDEHGYTWIEKYLNSYEQEQALDESSQLTKTLALVMSCVTKKEDRHAFLKGISDVSSEDVTSSGSSGFDLLRKLNSYGFAITNLQTTVTVGLALYVQCIPFMNHSCVPNCVYTFKGSRVECRVIRDIQPGEELTISYIDQIDTTKERGKQLGERYHFSCDCQLCKYYPANPLVQPEEEVLKDIVSEPLFKPMLDPKQGFVCPNPECKSSSGLRSILAIESQLQIYNKVELKCKDCEQVTELTQELVQESQDNAERLITAFVREMNGGSTTMASKAGSRNFELAKVKASSEAINQDIVAGGMKSAQEPSTQALQLFEDAYKALTGVAPQMRKLAKKSIDNDTVMTIEKDPVRHSKQHYIVRRLEQAGFDEAVSHKNWIFALHRSIELEQILNETYIGHHPLKAIQAYYTCKIANLLANLLLEESTVEIEDSDSEKDDEDEGLLDTDDENDLKALRDAMRKGDKNAGATSVGSGSMQEQLLRRKRSKNNEEATAEKKKRKALEKEKKKQVQAESSRELLQYLKSIVPKIENPQVLQEFRVCWGKDGKLAIRYRHQIDSLKQALHYAELPFSTQVE